VLHSRLSGQVGIVTFTNGATEVANPSLQATAYAAPELER